jgi:hypothetical protein
MAQGGVPVYREVQASVVEYTSPIAVTKVTFGAAVVQKGRFAKPSGAPQDPVTPFVADGDWIRGLTIYILNRTNKAIVQLKIAFPFPELTDYVAHTGAGVSIMFGTVPASALFDEKGRPVRLAPAQPAAPFRIGPGETLAIRLSDYMDKFMKDVDAVRPLAALTQLEVVPQGMFFEDGMRWPYGGYAIFDPGTSSWRRMGPNYFPGDATRYRPGAPGWIDHE